MEINCPEGKDIDIILINICEDVVKSCLILNDPTIID
jgi:hypothetical protein